MRMGRILIAEDDQEMRSLLSEFFQKKGYQVETHENAKRAYESILARKEFDIDLIISDIKMPEMTGIEFVDLMKKYNSSIPIVLITAFGSIESAVDAIQKGAYDYIVKPFKLAEVQVTVERALGYRRLKNENEVLREQLSKGWSLSDIIGKSAGMQNVFDLVKRVANVNANVLITGESGTGKEVVARAIHNTGPRAKKPFVAINCTAIPENLLESELFGHAKGSFTGAHAQKKGLFLEANGGTLFLDEIGDMDLSLQAKLLRVLQERKIRPVGDNNFYDVNVRIIAATHQNLKQAIKEGRFREDLYYRLSVIPVEIPALRQRREDIPLLANHFLKKYAAANAKRIKGFSETALKKLISARWDGNVRELENVVERALVLSQTDIIDVDDLPESEGSPEDFFANATRDWPTLEQLENRYIEVVMQKTGGRKSKAAQILGINRRTLYRKQKELGMPVGSISSSDEPTELKSLSV